MLIGITGSIGMGKSTVLRDFRQLGGMVMDADEIAHSLYEPGRTAYEAMVAHWGRGILGDGERIDRKAVGGIVFREPAELRWLNGLLHPLIREEMKAQARQSSVPVYSAVPLLYESGWEKDADAVVCVWCEPSVQHERLLARGWSEQEIASRLASQMPADEKLLRSDFAIVTSCSWDDLREQCRRVHEAVLKRMR